MKQFEKHTAIRLPWEDVSRLIGAEIAKIIGHEVSCRVSVDAHDYWGVGFCGYRMPFSEICRLIGALDLDNDTARYELPNFEDGETTIRDIGMDMAVTLLKRALPFQWEVSFMTRMSFG